MKNSEYEDKEIQSIKVDEPVRFEPENEPNNKTEQHHSGAFERVGLESIEPMGHDNKSGIGNKALLVLAMMLSAAAGAFSTWLFLF